MGTLSVHDLRVRCIVGVYTHERKIEQDLLIDLTLEFDFAEAARDDGIDQTIDYTVLTERLEAWIRKEQFKLIETLAERACDLICKEWPQVRRCQVTIKKPAALPKARYAAVTAERRAR
jgi:dihydroneopterin aldolase